MAGLPRVGDTVYYYDNGVNALPAAAIITVVHSSYLVNLMVVDGGRWVQKHSIHHKECAPVKANPVIAQNFGIWSHRDEDDELALMEVWSEQQSTLQAKNAAAREKSNSKKQTAAT